MGAPGVFERFLEIEVGNCSVLETSCWSSGAIETALSRLSPKLCHKNTIYFVHLATCSMNKYEVDDVKYSLASRSLYDIRIM